MKKQTFFIIVCSLISFSFQTQCMKRENSESSVTVTDTRAVKKAQSELKQKTSKLTKLTGIPQQSKEKSLPRPKSYALKNINQGEQDDEAAISYFRDAYNEFVARYKQAIKEDGVLQKQFFIELASCKSQIPPNMLKLHRAFNLLRIRAIEYIRSDEEDEDELILALDDLDIESQFDQ